VARARAAELRAEVAAAQKIQRWFRRCHEFRVRLQKIRCLMGHQLRTSSDPQAELAGTSLSSVVGGYAGRSP
jgi:hypothetical protein